MGVGCAGADTAIRPQDPEIFYSTARYALFVLRYQQEASLWEWEARVQMPTEPARVSLPLRDITTARRLHKAWRIGRSGRTLLLDVEFVWLAVLDPGGS